MKKLKQLLYNLSFSLIITLIFLFILEVIFRFVAPQDLTGSWRTMSPHGYMLNKASWESRHQFGDRIVHYRFNKFHQRTEEPVNDRYNILTLGDSYTFGWLLEEENTHVGLLQKIANQKIGNEKVQFLNAAAGGWGLADFQDYLVEFGDSIKPDAVLIFFNTDDIGRSLNRYKYHNPNAKSEGLKKWFNDSKLYQFLLEHSHLVQWIRSKLVNMSATNTSTATSSADGFVPGSDVNAQDVSKGVDLAKSIFISMNEWCKKRNIPFIVLTTGWHFDAFDGKQKTDPEIKFLQQADSFFVSQNQLYYDITPEVVAQMQNRKLQEYVIKNEYHPNEEGAKLIANASWNYLDTSFFRKVNLNSK